MSNADFGSLTIFLFLLLAAARIFGHLFTRLKQPKVVGEIFAGVLLGPTLLGHFAPSVSEKLLAGHGNTAAGSPSAAVLFFLYNFGLLLLMFSSGAETKGLFNREDRRQFKPRDVHAYLRALCRHRRKSQQRSTVCPMASRKSGFETTLQLAWQRTS